MINKYDNEKQMVSLEQKVLAGTLYFLFNLTIYTTPQSTPVPGLWDMLSDHICDATQHILCANILGIFLCNIYKRTAEKSDPVYHEAVIMTWMNRTWISYESWRIQTQLLRHESVRVCRPEVTQHADTINLSKFLWVLIYGMIYVACFIRWWETFEHTMLLCDDLQDVCDQRNWHQLRPSQYHFFRVYDLFKAFAVANRFKVVYIFIRQLQTEGWSFPVSQITTRWNNLSV